MTQEQIAQLQAELAELKYDKAFGILTRPAVAIEYRKNVSGGYVIFLDLDEIHELNDRLGYAQVDRLIKRALKIRSTDLRLAGRWASGDELFFYIQGNPVEFCKRLLTNLSKFGLSGTCAYTKATANIEKTVKKASDRVQQAKRENKRGTFYAA